RKRPRRSRKSNAPFGDGYAYWMRIGMPGSSVAGASSNADKSANAEATPQAEAETAIRKRNAQGWRSRRIIGRAPEISISHPHVAQRFFVHERGLRGFFSTTHATRTRLQFVGGSVRSLPVMKE